MNVNPVFEQERRRSSRSRKISWIVFCCNLCLSAVALVCFFGKSQISGFMRAGDYDVTVSCYQYMAYALFFLLVLVIPAVTAGSVSQERERGTLDVLLTTGLTPWRIICGKLEAVLALVFLIAFSAMPVVALIMVFGGVSLLDLFALVGLLMVSGIFMGSIGIFCSAVCKKTVPATILSYALLLLFVVGTVGYLGLSYYIELLKIEQNVYEKTVDLGKSVYVLLVNPFITFKGMLDRQVGSGQELARLCSRLGDYSDSFLVRHLVLFGSMFQLVLSGLLLSVAGYMLNPLRRFFQGGYKMANFRKENREKT